MPTRGRSPKPKKKTAAPVGNRREQAALASAKADLEAKETISNERRLRSLQMRTLSLEEADELRVKQTVAVARGTALSSARNRIFFEDLEDALQKVFARKIPDQKLVKGAALNGVSSRHRGAELFDAHLLISDTHFGAALDPREVGEAYGPQEEARRLARVASSFVDLAAGAEIVHLHLAGDIIQNSLHDPRDGAPLAQQCAEAIHLLTQLVIYLASRFKNIQVRCTTGNHGRNIGRHRDRAVYQKWDSIETIVYYAVKQATKNLPQISLFDIPRTQEFVFTTSFGQNGVVTHGDGVINTGYPASQIQVSGVNGYIQAWNANPKKPKIDMVACGHVHVGSVTHLPSGQVMITNPPLIPADSFANSKGGYSAHCGQYAWISTGDEVAAYPRLLRVGPEDDTDASLDAIIRTFTDF